VASLGLGSIVPLADKSNRKLFQPIHVAAIGTDNAMQTHFVCNEMLIAAISSADEQQHTHKRWLTKKIGMRLP
jgi:hypothetical protein